MVDNILIITIVAIHSVMTVHKSMRPHEIILHAIITTWERIVHFWETNSMLMTWKPLIIISYDKNS